MVYRMKNKRLSWAELASILIPKVAVCPDNHPAARTSSDKVGNEQNLLTNICRFYPRRAENLFLDFEMMEDDLHVRQPQWKMS